MDADQAKALRAPFPAAAVGKLPKPYRADSPRANCPECGGYHGMPAAHLDYVGHAATTDRLLAVDPNWTWEPLALDPMGLPALDGRGNLWIRLTVAGVTRIGVGDGRSAKEVIGDAIRNAAMRFGVALDLWAKEDLSAMATERGEPPAPPASAPVAAPAAPAEAPTPGTPHEAAGAAPNPTGPTGAQRARIMALYSARGVERADRIDDVRAVLGRPDIESVNDLTKAEASRLIDHLLAEAEA